VWLGYPYGEFVLDVLMYACRCLLAMTARQSR
jgi:hypothetical protein